MTTSIEAQYGTGRLRESILDALREAGHDPDHLDASALAPFEEFHTLGRIASTALADAAAIAATDRVLDVGCGIGGPARFLATRYGCTVTGIDLTPEFVEVARDLNKRVGLAEKIDVRVANATALPFADDTFDVVWTQHVSMNIDDKSGLYAEVGRVLRAGGRLAFFDIVAGGVTPAHFPVPWADTPDRSFLTRPDDIRTLLEAGGWEITHWEDLTPEALEWFTAMSEAPPPTLSPLGPHLLIPNTATKIGNVRRNLAEDRIRLLRCVATRHD